MKNVAVEVDVYERLMQEVAESGQSVSVVLREIFASVGTRRVVGDQDFGSSASALDALFTSTEFRFAKGVVGRFLVVLSWLHSENRDGFEVVENIKGRGRLYFAKEPNARGLLEGSGNSVNPKAIPNSPYWVITNTPTVLKQEILETVMRLLKYDQADIRRASAAIDLEENRTRALAKND